MFKGLQTIKIKIDREKSKNDSNTVRSQRSQCRTTHKRQDC